MNKEHDKGDKPMKKLTLLAALISTSAFASDIQQITTSEVYTKTEITQEYVAQQQPVLQPVHVYTGSTVTIRDHYDVYQPRVVYDKVGSYYNTRHCRYRCK